MWKFLPIWWMYSANRQTNPDPLEASPDSYRSIMSGYNVRMQRKKKNRKFYLYYLPEFIYNKDRATNFFFFTCFIEKAPTITAGAFSFSRGISFD
jgi:hypothetical protein